MEHTHVLVWHRSSLLISVWESLSSLAFVLPFNDILQNTLKQRNMWNQENMSLKAVHNVTPQN